MHQILVTYELNYTPHEHMNSNKITSHRHMNSNKIILHYKYRHIHEFSKNMKSTNIWTSDILWSQQEYRKI